MTSLYPSGDDGRVGRPPGSTLDATGNLCSFLDHWVARAPSRPALVEPRLDRAGRLTHRRLTFDELDRYASRLAHGLAARGLERGHRAVVMVPMSIDLYASLLAIAKLGACSVFLDPWASLDDMARAAALVEPQAFVGVPKAHLLRALSREFRRIPLKLSVGGPALFGERLHDVERGQPERFPAARVSPEAGAFLTFTTGSSGRPKGALRSHAFLHAQAEALERHLPRADGDVQMTSLPAFVLGNLGAGVPSVLPLCDLRRVADVDGGRIVEQLAEHEVTALGGSPPFVAAVARHCLEHDVTLACVRGVATGGAAVGRALLATLARAFPAARGNIRVLYGATEVEPISTVLADEVLAEPDERAGVLVGEPVAEVAVRLARLDGRPDVVDAATGEAGEVLVAGAHVQAEYFRDEEATRKSKLEGGGRLWHRTGDVARLDERGRLWLLGRVHEVVHARGEALYPYPVAAVASSVSGVARAALEEVGGAPVVAIELAGSADDADDADKVAGAVLEACRAAGFAVERVLVVDEVPLDPRHNAKVDHARLRARLERAA